MFSRLVLVAIGGLLGTLSRAGLSALLHRRFGFSFPWGTLSVNLLGCFAFGLIWGATEARAQQAEAARVALLLGFMGAFTTFSTFVFDVVQLTEQGRYRDALLNLVVQNLAGVLAMVSGLALGRRF